MKTVYNILCILFGVGMIIFGANKFFNFMPTPKLTPEQLEMFGAFGKIGWLMPLVAITEILGGLLVLLPKTRAVGALVMLPIIIGILAHHFHHDPAGIVSGLVFAVILLWILWENRKKYSQLMN